MKNKINLINKTLIMILDMIKTNKENNQIINKEQDKNKLTN